MSWLYRAAGIEMAIAADPAVDRALVETAVAWQLSGVRPTIAEMMLLTDAERDAWVRAGRLRAELEAAVEEPSADDIAQELLANWSDV